MRPGFVLAAVVLAFALACGSSGVAPSSLQACDFGTQCPAGETCNVSQTCGPPGPDGGMWCAEVTGDHLCHRDCTHNRECASGEACTSVPLAQRTDEISASYLCE